MATATVHTGIATARAATGTVHAEVATVHAAVATTHIRITAAAERSGTAPVLPATARESLYAAASGVGAAPILKGTVPLETGIVTVLLATARLSLPLTGVLWDKLNPMPPTALLLGMLLMNQTSAPPSSLDYPALAERLVQHMALQPGEKVLLLSHPEEFAPLVPLLRQAVVRAGGVDLGSWQVLAEVPPGLDRSASRAALLPLLRNVDLAVMLPGAAPSDPEYAAMQDVLRENRGRTIHFHWTFGGAPSAYPVPGHPLPSREVIDATYQRAVLQSDCRAIGEVQRRFAAALRSGEVRVTTPAGTDLRFRAGDRPVNLQDGDASAARAREGRTLIDREIEIPCGAIRVAPLEESVEGTIAFPPARWADREVEGLVVRFAGGKIVEVRARSGQDAVEAELREGGEAARSFRELALGFNPELAVPAEAPWIPYYGYGAGVVRLSLGDNSEVGGKVTGGYVRWNLFTDATLTAGGQTWVRDGKLTRETSTGSAPPGTDSPRR